MNGSRTTASGSPRRIRRRLSWIVLLAAGAVSGAVVLLGPNMSTSRQPPQIGERAPDFTLPGPGGAPVKLAELVQRGPLVLYFYPKDETAGCTVEACSFRDSNDKFAAEGAQVVGVSRDDEASHRRFADKHELPFLLLSDPTEEVHKLYGLGRTLGLLMDRVTFVIDREGIVRHVFSSKIRMNAHVLGALAAVKRLPR